MSELRDRLLAVLDSREDAWTAELAQYERLATGMRRSLAVLRRTRGEIIDGKLTERELREMYQLVTGVHRE